MKKTSESNQKFKILLKGPCDLQSVLPYLNTDFIVNTEFIHTNETGPYTYMQEHSLCTVDAKKQPNSRIKALLARTPFLTAEDYTTKIYAKGYDAIVFSLLVDDMTGCYRDKETGMVFPFGRASLPLTDEKNVEGYTKGIGSFTQGYVFNKWNLEEFRGKYEFLGPIGTDLLLENLSYIRENIDPTSKLILILGSEKAPTETTPDLVGMEERHREMNRAIERWAEGRNDTRLINITELIASPNDYTDNINHLSRKTYFKLAGLVAGAVSGDTEKARVNRFKYFKQVLNHLIGNILTVRNEKRQYFKGFVMYEVKVKYFVFFGLKIRLKKVYEKEVRYTIG